MKNAASRIDVRHEHGAPGMPSIFEIPNLSLYDLTASIRLRQAS
jgi:hypothetical protein